jgi:C4-dicarboxylate transporter
MSSLSTTAGVLLAGLHIGGIIEIVILFLSSFGLLAMFVKISYPALNHQRKMNDESGNATFFAKNPATLHFAYFTICCFFSQPVKEELDG